MSRFNLETCLCWKTRTAGPRGRHRSLFNVTPATNLVRRRYDEPGGGHVRPCFTLEDCDEGDGGTHTSHDCDQVVDD